MQARVNYSVSRMGQESYPKIQAIRNAKAGRTLLMALLKLAVLNFTAV